MKQAEVKAQQRFLHQQRARLEKQYGWNSRMETPSTYYMELQCDYCGNVRLEATSKSRIQNLQCANHYGLGTIRDFCVWREQKDVAKWRMVR